MTKTDLQRLRSTLIIKLITDLVLVMMDSEYV